MTMLYEKRMIYKAIRFIWQFAGLVKLLKAGSILYTNTGAV